MPKGALPGLGVFGSRLSKWAPVGPQWARHGKVVPPGLLSSEMEWPVELSRFAAAFTKQAVILYVGGATTQHSLYWKTDGAEESWTCMSCDYGGATTASRGKATLPRCSWP